jgi:hypothetical protein
MQSFLVAGWVRNIYCHKLRTTTPNHNVDLHAKISHRKPPRLDRAEAIEKGHPMWIGCPTAGTVANLSSAPKSCIPNQDRLLGEPKLEKIP